MKKFNLEIAVGIFLLSGILALAYISVKLGEIEIIGRRGYTVYAYFDNAGGIRAGAVVEVAGVRVGTVQNVSLEAYQAKLTLRLDPLIKLQEDVIASIKTKGLIGEKYVQITPGGSEKLIPHNGRIRETESAMDIEELISKYIFGRI
ncbi:MAG TPA: outer membrane lipid asymmetry maintenance protein MlaD [Nitrospiraceae bacterium]|nr:outer membrane lipid asymmetry maintenance protein MlaD [Nitrospiraceae bacterium]